MDTQEFWLTLAAVAIPTAAVAFTAWLNYRAHTGIVQRIAGVDQSSVDRDEAQSRALGSIARSSVDRDEAHRGALESIARDVSFMAGRQAERDRA